MLSVNPDNILQCQGIYYGFRMHLSPWHIQKRKVVRRKQYANRPIIVDNRITFSTVIGQFAYCLCLITLKPMAHTKT